VRGSWIEVGSESAGIRATAPASRSRVVIAIEDLVFHQEVFDFLGRDAALEVTGSATEPSRIGAVLSSAEADAVVVCPAFGRAIARHPERPGAATLVLVAEEMTVPVLRSAVEAGAHGAFCWPEERRDLRDVIAGSRRAVPAPAGDRGLVVGVLGARGGVGATFVASHLAAALATRGAPTALVEIGPAFSDLTAALGIGREERTKTVADLVPVLDELGPDHVEQAMHRHERGFDVLLSPAAASLVAVDQPIAGADVDPNGVDETAKQAPAGLYAAAVALLAGDRRAVVLHLARTFDPSTRVAANLADMVLIVIGLDLMSLYGARRLMAELGPAGGRGSWHVVVTAARRSDVTEADVERVLGLRPVARIRSDRAVGRAQDLGRLLGARSKGSWRDIERLASFVMQAEPRSPRGA